MEEMLKFYEWLVKIKNIHLSDNERMEEAFIIIRKNNQTQNNEITDGIETI